MALLSESLQNVSGVESRFLSDYRLLREMLLVVYNLQGDVEEP